MGFPDGRPGRGRLGVPRLSTPEDLQAGSGDWGRLMGQALATCRRGGEEAGSLARAGAAGD